MDRPMAAHSSRLWLGSRNTDSRRERMLKAWKISIMDRVRKAMVMPSALFTMAQAPASI